jgi:hypothetical protein
MSLDESIGKIEVDPKEEASVVEACFCSFPWW